MAPLGMSRDCPWTGPKRTCLGVKTVCQSELPVVLDASVCGDVCRGAAGGPALVVDGHGVQCHVRVGVLDMDGECGHVAAKAHRPDSGLVQELEQLALLNETGIGPMG